MRKTDKKSKRLSFAKSGVILVTVIFIVAMALVFITTALTITIASRQRVYSNAKADQARLTVTSLAQSIWNAIYYQQINDNMLVALAQGTGGDGTLVTFKNDEIPGMTGDAKTSTTAYFYKHPTDPLKICIECKCEIDGVAQYYTLVLLRHDPEGTPSSMFDLTVDLGDGGQLCRGVFGFDVSGSTDYNNLIRVNKPDNVMFLHNATYSGLGNMGFGSTIITDGILDFQNSCFNGDVYFIGPDAGFDFIDKNLITPSGSGQTAGDFYFIGTNFPLRQNGVSLNGSGYVAGNYGDYIQGGVSEIYFEYAADGSGFANFNSNAPVTWGSDTFSRQAVHYDSGIFTTSWLNARESSSNFHPNGSNSQHASTMNNYINITADRLDTIQEVETNPTFAGHTSGGTSINTGLNATTGLGTQASPIKAGTYTWSGDTSRDYYFDVSGGNIYINISSSLSIKNFVIIEGSSNTNRVYIFLHNGAYIDIGGGGYFADVNPWDASQGAHLGAGSDNCGIVDLRCYDRDSLFDSSDTAFTGAISSSDFTIANTDQADNRTPRCIIFTLYDSSVRKYGVVLTGNGYNYLNAYLGFYYRDGNGNHMPHDPEDGSPAWIASRTVPSGNSAHRLYGRWSAGGITTPAGGFFGLPYCPAIKDDDNVRESAYRDNTDYSVVMDECYYFTQYTGT